MDNEIYTWKEYKAVLYGLSSMVVFKNDKEILHTGSRTCNTSFEVMGVLKTMPEYEKMIENIDSKLKGV